MTTKRLNFNATTMEEAKQYMLTRIKQMGHLGVTSDEEFEEIDGKAIRVILQFSGQSHAAYYVLDQHRGNGLMTSLLKDEDLPILTIGDCGIREFLIKVNPKGGFIILDTKVLDSDEYKAIQDYYGDERAKRSGVFLMNHIDEGLTIMKSVHASNEAMRAYCLHPILQNDSDLLTNINYVRKFDPYVVALAMEYRNKANRYLCRPNTDHIQVEDLDSVVGPLLTEVRHMLIADKVQNQKDFELYHKGTHERSEQLTKYFDNWNRWLRPNLYR